ncbi:MAG: acetyl-CoA C-acetyltransferase [Kofleriaceae bacterium]|nr:acetyl-CoA C-acetyltransferase [Kofleriaceae bacterium]MCL4226266.1 acetyl-CoA C-acetyltransferase [Myxococcales bacterium]
MADVYIFDALRTPRGRGKAGKGGLSHLHPQEILAQTLNAMAARLGLDTRLVDDVSMGCVTQVKEQGACIARNALIAAGWPEEVTGFTVNRFCGSGLEAINSIAAKIGAGFIDGGIGGGVESMSRVPIGADGAMIDGLNEKLRQRVFMVPQGISADLIATREGFTRADVDAFALETQRRAARAIEEKRFERGLFAVKNDDGSVALDRDEHPRPDTTAESLGALQPAFAQMGAAPMGRGGATLDAMALERYPDTAAIDHVHTAGNSSGIVDGAAALLMGSKEWGARAGLTPRARIRAMATAGAEPVIMLTAPAPASQKALDRAGMKVADIDLWEINEAFAVVPLETMRKLGIDRDRVNVNGGAIALGHPLGATGAILLGTALDELERTGKATALATLCIGGGMGIATIIERV